MTAKRIWITHPETGATGHCPEDAVEDWKTRGWVEGSAPAHINPVTEHRAAAAAPAAPVDDVPEQTPVDDGAQPAAKPATRRRGVPSEGSD